MDQRVLSLEALSTRIINRVQPEEDGGICRYLQDNDPLQNPHGNFFLDFIKYCNNQKGTYQTTLIVGIIWASLIPVLVLCFLVASCLRKCFSKCNSQTKACSSFSNFLARTYKRCFPSKRLKEDRKAKSFSCLARARPPRIHMPGDPRGRVLKALSVLIILLLVLFAIAVLLSFVVGKPLQAAMDNPSGPASLRGMTSQSLDAFERFVTRAVWGGQNTTSNVVSNFSSELKALIRKAVGRFTDGLLLDYGVTTLFDTANRAITDIQNVLNAMDFIKKSQNNIFVRYHEFNGFVNTYGDLLRSLDRVCNLTMSNLQRRECRRLVAQRNKLEVSIDQSKINFDSSTSLLFILKEMQVNISTIANEIQKARTSIDTMLSTVYVSIQKDFNLNSIFDSLDALWSTAMNFSDNQILTPLDNIRNGTIDDTFTLVSSIWKVFFGGIGYILFSVIIVSICFMVMVVAKQVNSKTKQSEDGNTLRSNASDKELLKGDQKRLIPVGLFTAFGVIFVFFLIIPAAIVVASFYAGGIAENEACRYMKTPHGISLIDDIADSYIKLHWPTWTSSLNIDLSGVTLNLKPPQGILTALTGVCVNDSQRLMQAIGLTNILNVTELIYSPMLTKMINSGKVYAKKMIGELKVANLIPSTFTNVLREAVNLTKMMVDDVNYRNSINELRKPLLKLDDYPQFVADLKAFVNSILVTHKTDSNLVFISKLIDPMQRKVEEYRTLTALLNEVKENFEVLNRTRRISSGIHNLIVQFDAAMVVLKNPDRMVKVVDPIYDGVMSWAVPNIGRIATKSFNTLESSLFPCDDLATAFHTAAAGICEVLLPELTAFIVSYGWCVLCFQVLFLSMWVLVNKVKRQQRHDDSDC